MPLVMVALLTVPPLVLTSGCKTAQSSRAIAGKTLLGIAQSVDAAMRTYAEAVKLGQVNAETQAKIRDLHGRYQPALEQAVIAARFNFESAAPHELAAMAAEITATIVQIVRKS